MNRELPILRESTFIQRTSMYGGKFIVHARRTVQREKWAALLIGIWALGMMSLPIVLWIIGESQLPVVVSITTGLQAAAVVAVLGKVWGWRRTITTVVTIAIMGWLVEFVGSKTGFPFGVYGYTGRLQPQLGGVPLLIPVAWFMLMPCAWTIASLLAGGRRWLFVVMSVAAFVAWDLFLDPQMVTWDFWRWSQPGGYFGIPWSNYAGWALAALLMTLIVRPPQKAYVPLVIIYGLTWFFETFGLLFFWGLVGPAVIGGVVMGGFLIAALWKLRLASTTIGS